MALSVRLSKRFIAEHDDRCRTPGSGATGTYPAPLLEMPACEAAIEPLHHGQQVKSRTEICQPTIARELPPYGYESRRPLDDPTRAVDHVEQCHRFSGIDAVTSGEIPFSSDIDPPDSLVLIQSLIVNDFPAAERAAPVKEDY